jgi:hypothetical protein
MSGATGDIDVAQNPAGVVYGVLTMGALLATEGGRSETYWQAIGSSAIALLLYWFAHAYPSLLGDRLSRGGRLGPRPLIRAFINDWQILRGACVPLAGLLICWAAGLRLASALTVAVWSCVACLIALEILAGVRAQAKPHELALEASVGAAMGLAIIVLRIVLH